MSRFVPLKGHRFHDKSDDELRFVITDAGDAARAMRGVNYERECHYLDEVNDACTILAWRQTGGKTNAINA